ncbi:MAG: hypothetical protein AB7V53_06250, partial [Dongiaceae bacterium]
MIPEGAQGQAANGNGGDAVSRIAAELRPIVNERFADKDRLLLPRQALAVEISGIVGRELEERGATLNILERRSLIALLVAEIAAKAEAERRIVESQATEALAEAPAPSRTAEPASPRSQAPAADTPSQLAPAPVATHQVGARAKQVSSARNTIESAKNRIQPLVVDRIDLSTAVKLDRAQLTHQIAELVGEVLVEQRIRLNQREQRDLVEILLDDMLGLGPLEPLLADESV